MTPDRQLMLRYAAGLMNGTRPGPNHLFPHVQDYDAHEGELQEWGLDYRRLLLGVCE